MIKSPYLVSKIVPLPASSRRVHQVLKCPQAPLHLLCIGKNFRDIFRPIELCVQVEAFFHSYVEFSFKMGDKGRPLLHDHNHCVYIIICLGCWHMWYRDRRSESAGIVTPFPKNDCRNGVTTGMHHSSLPLVLPVHTNLLLLLCWKAGHRKKRECLGCCGWVRRQDQLKHYQTCRPTQRYNASVNFSAINSMICHLSTLQKIILLIYSLKQRSFRLLITFFSDPECSFFF